MTKVRAIFDGKVLVPLQSVDLPQGKELELRVDILGPLVPGTPAALLAAMHSMPKISEEDVKALERSIEGGRIPVDYRGCFDDLIDEEEGHRSAFEGALVGTGETKSRFSSPKAARRLSWDWL